MRTPGRSSSRKGGGRPAGSGRQGGGVGGPAGTRTRPGGKPRTAASGAATGASGSRRRDRAHLTSRAAILAVVVCAIVLSLAYPVREYIAQRRQIAELRAEAEARQQQIADLRARKRKLNNPEYVKQQARRRLHYCMPGETCYVVVGPDDQGGNTGSSETSDGGERPWYVNLWMSIESADRPGAR